MENHVSFLKLTWEISLFSRRISSYVLTKLWRCINRVCNPQVKKNSPLKCKYPIPCGIRRSNSNFGEYFGFLENIYIYPRSSGNWKFNPRLNIHSGAPGLQTLYVKDSTFNYHQRIQHRPLCRCQQLVWSGLSGLSLCKKI